MTSELFVRGLCTVILCGAFAYGVFSRYDNEVGSELDDSGRQKYLPYLNGSLLPIFIIMLLAFSIPIYGVAKTLEIILPTVFGIFLHISVYYLILMLLIPHFRKRISSRACALLWILPNYLYITIQPAFELSEPLVILHLTKTILWVALIIWLLGFFFVLIRAVVQHFYFRRSILKSAVAVENPEVLEIWKRELDLARVKKPKYQLVISEEVSTPLSIGFFNRTIRVVLPNRHYSIDELALILRHEIIHICRGDSLNKFFLIFCCAMCWFNPLMWIAMRKSADDLELSCDETVLLDAGDESRRQYADLILSTAGDSRGFTTCLSASPSALRYRLHHIVRPRVQSSGAFVVAVVFFFLCMTCGYVTFSYGDFSGNEIFYDRFGENCSIDGLNTSLIDHNGFVECNEEALNAYIGNLHLQKISGNYAFSEYENEVLVFYGTENDSYALNLKDQFLTITTLGRNSREETYFVKTSIDWDYLTSLFKTRYIQDAASPFPPMIDFIVTAQDVFNGYGGTVTKYITNGVEQPEEPWWKESADWTFTDPSEASVRVIFYNKPTAPFRVEITDMDGNILNTLSSDQLQETDRIPILSEDAKYAIYATYEDSESYMEMVYTFTVTFSAG